MSRYTHVGKQVLDRGAHYADAASEPIAGHITAALNALNALTPSGVLPRQTPAAFQADGATTADSFDLPPPQAVGGAFRVGV